jgi:HAD superfamily hydrolase (TIGR01509 family)
VHPAIDVVRHPKAVASSSTAHHLETKLRKVGLWDRFAPHIYSADHVRHAKPAPDLFLHAADKLAVAPDRCLVIEDSIMGITAARAAGMRVWGFVGGSHNDQRSGPRLLDAGVERIVTHWAEAASLFASL